MVSMETRKPSCAEVLVKLSGKPHISTLEEVENDFGEGDNRPLRFETLPYLGRIGLTLVKALFPHILLMSGNSASFHRLNILAFVLHDISPA